MAGTQTHNTADNASNLQDQFLTARYNNKGESCGERGVPSHPSIMYFSSNSFRMQGNVVFFEYSCETDAC